MIRHAKGRLGKGVVASGRFAFPIWTTARRPRMVIVHAYHHHSPHHHHRDRQLIGYDLEDGRTRSITRTMRQPATSSCVGRSRGLI